MTGPSASEPTTFIDLEPDQCAWAMEGKPGPAMLCCGAPVRAIGPLRRFCSEHLSIATKGRWS